MKIKLIHGDRDMVFEELDKFNALGYKIIDTKLCTVFRKCTYSNDSYIGITLAITYEEPV